MGFHPYPNRPTNGLSLCAGAGGLDMGLMLSEPDFHTRCFVEWDEHACDRIIAAQRAGYFDPAPIWDDVTSFDGRPFRGAIDTILAGYPCQPFSHAGRRKGEDDERHLWPDIARIITEIEPEWVFLENVAGHVTLGAETVLRTLREMGWTPAAGLFTAEETGSTHERLRWFCVAHRAGRGCGIGGDEAQPRRSGYVDRGNIDLANPDGWHTGPEWQQRGGQQRLYAQGGKTGGGALVHRGRAERRAGIAEGYHGHGEATGRDQSAGGAEQSSDDVDDPQSRGWAAGRDGDHGGNVGHQPCPATSAVANTDGAGYQRRPWSGSTGQRGGEVAHGPTAKRSGAWLFPPRPDQSDIWASYLASNPLGGPSIARCDAKTAAISLAALFTADTATRLEPGLSKMESLSELGSLVSEAGGVVDQAETIARFCGVAHGLAQRTRALRILGNGVQPIQAAYAWRTLSAALGLGGMDLATTDRCTSNETT
jgi:site-specific DNA-cytosine methylase